MCLALCVVYVYIFILNKQVHNLFFKQNVGAGLFILLRNFISCLSFFPSTTMMQKVLPDN